MTSLAKLREHGVVSVADSARSAWSHLLTTNDEAACIFSAFARWPENMSESSPLNRRAERCLRPNKPLIHEYPHHSRKPEGRPFHNAERQLAQIAHDQGDEIVALLVADLTPGEVASFLEEGDYSKPSEVTQFLTRSSSWKPWPALERNGGKISKNDGRELLLRLKEEVATFILPTLLHREDRLFIKAMLEDTLGEDIIVALPLYETGYLESLREFDSNMAQKGTWQELYAIIQEMDPRLFILSANMFTSFPTIPPTATTTSRTKMPTSTPTE
ncbi:MAG: hypothetical protein WDO13_21855 [Verrucomicrobiota bacterium]